MAERVRTRQAEPEARQADTYEASLRQARERDERAAAGRIVVHASDVPLQHYRQGLAAYYLHPTRTENAVTDWKIIWHEIRTHSGRHVHQGGLAIYVVAGKGYTLVDGKRVDWEAGDMIVLPIKPGGVEHQHFNLNDGEPAIWVALIYHPWMEIAANVLEQKEASPTYEAVSG